MFFGVSFGRLSLLPTWYRAEGAERTTLDRRLRATRQGGHLMPPICPSVFSDPLGSTGARRAL